jgi:hypothetical protein
LQPPSKSQLQSPSQPPSQLDSRSFSQPLSQPHSVPQWHTPSRLQPQPYTQLQPQPYIQVQLQPYTQLQLQPYTQAQPLPYIQPQSQQSSHSQLPSQPTYQAALPHHPPPPSMSPAPPWPSPEPSLPVAHVTRVLGVMPQDTIMCTAVAPSHMPWPCAEGVPLQQIPLDCQAPPPTTAAPSKPASAAVAMASAFGSKRPRSHGGSDIMDAANGLRALRSLASKPGGASEVTESETCVERPVATA